MFFIVVFIYDDRMTCVIRKHMRLHMIFWMHNRGTWGCIGKNFFILNVFGIIFIT